MTDGDDETPASEEAEAKPESAGTEPADQGDARPEQHGDHEEHRVGGEPADREHECHQPEGSGQPRDESTAVHTRRWGARPVSLSPEG